MYPYNTTLWEPPAPAAEAAIWSPGNPSKIKKVIALIDSGADITLIPQGIIDELQLMIVDEARVGGYDTPQEEYKRTFLYTAFFQLGQLKPRILSVAPLERRNYVILGRDILNHWRITLDGPRQKMKIFE